MNDKNTVRKLSLNEYLASRSLQSPVSDFMIDKLKIPCGLTKRQEDKLMCEADKARNDDSMQRNAAIREYEDLVMQYVMRELLPEVQRMNTNFTMCICLDNEGNLSRVISNFGKMDPEEMIQEALQGKTDSLYLLQASAINDEELEGVKDLLEQC